MMRIRYYQPVDIPAIAQISAQLGYPCSPEDMRAFLQTLEGNPDHAIFVAELGNGAVAGWVHVFLARRVFVPPFAEIGGLVVGESHRGMGIGKLLVLEAEEWARAAGCDLLRIRSNVNRAAAHDFYERVGYAVQKTQKVYDKSLPEH